MLMGVSLAWSLAVQRFWDIRCLLGPFEKPVFLNAAAMCTAVYRSKKEHTTHRQTDPRQDARAQSRAQHINALRQADVRPRRKPRVFYDIS